MDVDKRITILRDNVVFTLHINAVKYKALESDSIYAIAVYDTGHLIYNTNFNGNLYPREIITTSDRPTKAMAIEHWISSKAVLMKKGYPNRIARSHKHMTL